MVLAAGTALAGLCYCLTGISSKFALLVLALLLGGIGAAPHPIASALVTRTFSGARSLRMFGTYNFAGDVGKVLVPATATSLLLIMPWRPAYALLGFRGLAAAVVIATQTVTFKHKKKEPRPGRRPCRGPLTEPPYDIEVCGLRQDAQIIPVGRNMSQVILPYARKKIPLTPIETQSIARGEPSR